MTNLFIQLTNLFNDVTNFFIQLTNLFNDVTNPVCFLKYLKLTFFHVLHVRRHENVSFVTKNWFCIMIIIVGQKAR